MKTLQEFYEGLKVNDDLKRELSEALRAGKVTEFMKAHDCDSTADELKEFFAEKKAKDGRIELNYEELEMVAGGTRAKIEQDLLAYNIEGVIER